MNTFANTSAMASIDGDDLHTLHASEMADTLADYSRSVALVVDIADLHMLRELLNEARRPGNDDRIRAERLHAAIDAAFEAGLR
jgi:hypothetical protein